MNTAFSHNLGWACLTVGTLTGASIGTYIHFSGKPQREIEQRALLYQRQKEFAEAVAIMKENKKNKRGGPVSVTTAAADIGDRDDG